MISSPSRICWLGSALLLTAACSKAQDVVVLGDTVKYAHSEDPDQKSSFYDGERVRLRAARGETLGLQVFAKGKEVSIRLPAGAARVQSYRVDFVEVAAPSTEMYGESRGAGTYPDVLVATKGAVKAGKQAYFDVSVPTQASPGIHEGELVVSGHAIPLALTVENVEIHPEKTPLVWAFYHPKEVARIHGVPDDDGPAQIELESQYHGLFREHGVLLATNLRPNRFEARSRFVKDVRYWPVALDVSSPETIKADVKRWLGYFEGSSVTPFTIPIDEPASLQQKERAKAIADQVKSAGGGAPRLLRGVTDRALPLYGDSIDLYFAPRDIPETARSRKDRGELFWTYNGKPPQAGSMIIDTDGNALRTWGWIAFRYGIDLWYAWEALYFSDRYNDGAPTNIPADPITFDERTRGGTDFGNGDGLLAYPGPNPSLRLKALRRGLQDRLLLLELERCGGGGEAHAIAQKVIPRALGEATGRPEWPAREIEWENARHEVLDAISRRCHASI